MSLKQFPAPPSKRKPHENAIPPRMVATIFDPTTAWDVIERRREKIKDYVDISGFGNVDRRKAEDIARAAGIRITTGFSVAKAVDSYRKSKFREMQAYLAFLLIFTVNTYYYGDFEHANQIKASLETALFDTQYLASESGKFITFGQVNSASDFWDYVTNCFSAGLFPLSGECIGSCTESSGLQNLMKYNKLVQPIRLRQLRVNSVRAQDCDIAVDMIVSGADFKCWPTYSRDNENKSAIFGWPNGSKLYYSSSTELRTEVFGKGATATYDGGGFVIDIPLGASPEFVSQLLHYLKANQWTDLGTRAVFIDLCVYNPSFEFFTSIRILFEFLPFGDVRPIKTVSVFKGAPMPNVLGDSILYYMDLVLYVLLLLFVIWDLKRISQIGWLYLRTFWNWVSILNYLIFSFAFVQKQLYLNLEPIRAFSQAPPTIDNTSSVFDFTVIGQQYTTTSVLVGYSALLCWARILSYIRYFNRDLSLLVSTVGNCALDTLVWFFVIGIIVFVYAQAFFLAFGPSVDGFNTLAQSIGTMCDWLFRRVDAAEIIGVDQGVASLLFISFQALYFLLLFNLLWIVIIRAYKDVRNQGVDDPIAVEVRKLVLSSMRLWQSLVARLVCSWLPHQYDDNTDGREGGDHHQLVGLVMGQETSTSSSLPGGVLGNKVRLKDMTAQEYQAAMTQLRLAMEALRSETRYMADRLLDLAPCLSPDDDSPQTLLQHDPPHEPYGAYLSWSNHASDRSNNASDRSNNASDRASDNKMRRGTHEAGSIIMPDACHVQSRIAHVLSRYESLVNAWLP